MNKLLKKIGLLFFILVNSKAIAQTDAPVEMATGLYQSGKIYVVVGVIAIIFVGIILYLISIDRKVSKLEKDFKNK